MPHAAIVFPSLLLAAVLACASPVAAATGLAPDRSAKVDSAVAAVIARNHIPGLSIAIASGGTLSWQKAYGLADVENEVPATTRTVYRIASTSKPLTAVAALRLAEAGKLDLDVPIQRYAPTYGYTTFGYTLLGVAMEGASGRGFAELMRELVFEPAGMANTRLDDVAAIVPHRARGYSPLVYGRFDGRWRNATLMDASSKLPGGGVLSTAEDLARFAIALEDGRLLGEDLRRAMATSGTARDGGDTGYGYGWYVERLDGLRRELIVHHGGVQAGFTAELWTLPERRFTVAVLTNLEGGGRLGLATLARDIARIVLD